MFKVAVVLVLASLALAGGPGEARAETAPPPITPRPPRVPRLRRARQSSTLGSRRRTSANDPYSPVTVPAEGAVGKRQRPLLDPAQLAGASEDVPETLDADAMRILESLGVATKLGSHAMNTSVSGSAWPQIHAARRKPLSVIA